MEKTIKRRVKLWNNTLIIIADILLIIASISPQFYLNNNNLGLYSKCCLTPFENSMLFLGITYYHLAPVILVMIIIVALGGKWIK